MSLEVCPNSIVATECTITSPEDHQLVTRCRGGFLKSSVDRNTMYLTDMEVPTEARRMGVGRMMLRRTALEAYSMGVRRIIADLTTQAAVDAVAHAYGNEAVSVLLPGTYDEDNPNMRALAVAMLDYQLPEGGFPEDFLTCPGYSLELSPENHAQSREQIPYN